MAKKSFVDKCFKDKQGRLTLTQSPNAPLLGWIVCRIAERLPLPHHFQYGLHQLGTLLLFSWAFLELTSGVNYFRHALGLTVIVLTMAPYFRV